ncbi:hypothetical protein ACLKA6_008858 [Drosophila palustris]
MDDNRLFCERQTQHFGNGNQWLKPKLTFAFAVDPLPIHLFLVPAVSRSVALDIRYSNARIPIRTHSTLIRSRHGH